MHRYFRAAQRQREPVIRFRFRKRYAGASQKFIKSRTRKLRGERDGRDVAAASQGVAGAKRTKKIAIEIFRIVFAKTARRIRQHAERVNDSLFHRQRINEWLQGGAR